MAQPRQQLQHLLILPLGDSAQAGSPPFQAARCAVPKLLIGVCGSSSVQDLGGYVVTLLRELQPDIRLILTPAACHMLSIDLLSATAGVRAYSEFFDRDDEVRVPHSDLTAWADAFLVLPATANTIGKAAHGIADNLLTMSILYWAKPVVFFPNVNPRVWNSPVFQRNVDLLIGLGHRVVAPTGNARITATGQDTQDGHMPPPRAVARYVSELLTGKEE